MKRESFVFYRSFFEAIEKLKKNDKLTVYSHLCRYALGEEVGELDGVPGAIFDLIKPQVDANFQRYENGSKGGRPKTKQNQTEPNETKQNQTEPNRAMNKEEDYDKEKEDDKENKEKVKRESRRFTPPAREEVAAYIAEKGYRVDPDRWMAYYESNGWKVGKNPMKDWKAAVRTWATNGVDAKPAQKVPAQNDYAQRTYEERKPNKLPQWLQDMVDSGEAVV